MPRQTIKERAFQEPIHEDAPGFNPNLGHRNLITELNEDVLPSFATDLVGPADADPTEYQFRVNADNQLEYYFAGEWRLLRVGGAAGGSRSYRPTKLARLKASAYESGPGIVMLPGFTTAHALTNYELRAYQFGLLRYTRASLVSTNPDGTKTYDVYFEGQLEAGDNFFELKYGQVDPPYDLHLDARLLPETNAFTPMPASGGVSGGAIRLLSSTPTSAYPMWLPRLNARTDLTAANGWAQITGGWDDGGQASDPARTYVDPVSRNTRRPFFGGAHISLNADTPNDLNGNQNIPVNTIGLYRWAGDWYNTGIWRYDNSDGICYAWSHGPYSGNRTQFLDYVFFHKNGVISFGSYDGGGRADVAPQYRTAANTLLTGELRNATYSQPTVNQLVSTPIAAVLEQDVENV